MDPQRTREYGQFGKKGAGNHEGGQSWSTKGKLCQAGSGLAVQPEAPSVSTQGMGSPQSLFLGVPTGAGDQGLWRWPPGIGLSRGHWQPWVLGSPLEQKQGPKDSHSLPGRRPGPRPWTPLLCEQGSQQVRERPRERRLLSLRSRESRTQGRTGKKTGD